MSAEKYARKKQINKKYILSLFVALIVIMIFFCCLKWDFIQKYQGYYAFLGTIIAGLISGGITFGAMLFIDERNKERWLKDAYLKRQTNAILKLKDILKLLTNNYFYHLTTFYCGDNIFSEDDLQELDKIYNAFSRLKEQLNLNDYIIKTILQEEEFLILSKVGYLDSRTKEIKEINQSYARDAIVCDNNQRKSKILDWFVFNFKEKSVEFEIIEEPLTMTSPRGGTAIATLWKDINGKEFYLVKQITDYIKLELSKIEKKLEDTIK